MIIFDASHALHRMLHLDAYFNLSFNNLPTGGIFGVLETTRNVIAVLPKSKRVFVWDSGHSERRQKLYPEYKANRKPKTETDKLVAEEYFSSYNQQRAMLRDKFLPCLGIASVTFSNKEGDDIIYQLCNMYQNEDIYIISEDQDMLQLVTFFEKVKVYAPIKKQMVSRENFEQVVGIPYQVFLLYKAMLGDKSDNIKGVPGVGEVTAKQFCNGLDYSRMLESLLERAKEKNEHFKKTGKGKREASLYEGWATISTNLEMIDLRREPFNGLDLTELKKYIDSYPPNLFKEQFLTECKFLGFNSILKESNSFFFPFE